MANGRSHNAATLALAGCTLGVAIATRSSVWAAITAGALVGMFVGPDLDVERGNISSHNIRLLAGRKHRSTGDVAAAVWRGLWHPYARILHHRSFWSHAPLVGTIVRLLYLSVWTILPAYLITTYLPYLAGVIVSLAAAFGWYVFAGLCAADLLHWVMDR